MTVAVVPKVHKRRRCLHEQAAHQMPGPNTKQDAGGKGDNDDSMVHQGQQVTNSLLLDSTVQITGLCELHSTRVTISERRHVLGVQYIA